ncbi:MAG: glycoside hydrolase family 32 protein [Bacillaceae bacterium]
MKALEEGKKKMDTTFRLGYHIMAPCGWINDPNGMVYFNGEYHAFYQHHPYDENWGPMHWGHVKSKDLVHWEHLPIALAPGDDCDKDGCFSGSAVDNNGELTLIYTGHNWIDQANDIVFQVQNVATSKDGIHFEKVGQNPVISKHPEDGTGHFRDPKVWKHEDHWYMVLGNRTPDDWGRVILYKSPNLIDWEYVGVLAEEHSIDSYMWECPDFFELDGQHVLLFSPQGMKPVGDKYHNLHQTGYLMGNYNYETNTFNYGEFAELDHGHDFYAVQTLNDDKGRRIAVGWMDMWESNMPTKEHGWAGALTLPRELTIKNNKIIMKPVEELTSLRTSTEQKDVTTINNEEVVISTDKDLVEVEVTFALENTTASQFGVMVRCSEDGTEKTVIGFDNSSSKLVLDRNASGVGVDGVRRHKMELENNQLTLRIFVDRSSVEVFANDGDAVMTSRIYPKKDSVGVRLFAKDGAVNVVSCNVHSLEDIWNEGK